MRQRRAWRFFVADGHALRSPIAADREPWGRRMTNPRCALGCDPVPGRCGHCGYTVILEPGEFAEIVDQLERQQHLRGEVIVGARVTVRGPIRIRPALYWINLRAAEYRAGDIELDHLYVHERDRHIADQLAEQYGVPVTTSLTRAALEATP